MATCPTIRDLPGAFDTRRAKSDSPSLFSTVPPHGDAKRSDPPPPEPTSKRVGIARLATLSPRADAKRGTEYFLLPAHSILNRCDSERAPFPWTVNPYRGCEFGCHYCFARYTHEFMELNGEDFEHKIFVKQDAGALAARDLISKGLRGEHIAIGAATDPYQPAEKEFGATRAVLEQMAQKRGLSVSITTKSNLIVRDLALLKRISETSVLRVNMTVTTLRTGLARLLEPRAPRPDLRLEALAAVRSAGIDAGVLAMPILPWLTDGQDDLDALAKAAKAAGAMWFAGNVLYLTPTPRKQFFAFLAKRFPLRARRYQEWYARTGNAPESYVREIGRRVADLREKYGLATRPPLPQIAEPQENQLALF